MVHLALALVITSAVGQTAPQQSAGPIEIPSVLITLIDQVDVPAREAGVLEGVEVREGQMVKEGDLLAQIVDTRARIAEERAKIEVDVARKNMENDVNIRFAKKSLDVSKAELDRSIASNKKYPKSISESEMDRLRLVVERAELEVEQAEYEFAIAEFTRRIKENEHRSAQQDVQRRKITSPIDGVVVDVHRHRGEWVEPGDALLRVLRLDRLRAEGFVDVADTPGDLTGCKVRITVDIPGESGAEFPGVVVFLSPEIDPVNSQIRIWAEIENRELQLRPGMRADLIVEPPLSGSASAQ